jgi:mono/diheme cytochrome c family protein
MTGARWVVLAASLSFGCELSRGGSYDYPDTPQDFGGGVGGDFGGTGGFPGLGSFTGSGGLIVGPSPGNSFTPAPVRNVTSAAKAPPAISGGTLLITADGKLAVAADPDRDRVSIVSLMDQVVLHTVRLEAGDEPGRLVEDAGNRVHVALRRGGALVTIDLSTGAIVARRAVCGLPRGVAYEAETDQVHVACSGGQLVSFLASGGDPIRSLRFDIDLRDVIATHDGLLVSRFKSADLLRVAPNGELVGRTATNGIERIGLTEFDENGEPTVKLDKMAPAAAWRTVGASDGSTLMLHQYALSGPVIIDDPDEPPGSAPPIGEPTSGYGAPPGRCGGIVQSGVSSIEADGTVYAGAPLLATVLPVDAAVSTDSQWIAVAVAGASQLSQRIDATFAPSEVGRVQIYGRNKVTANEGGTDCVMADATVNFGGQATAVAFNPTIVENAEGFGVWFAVQTRDPAGIVLVRDVFGTPPVTVPLGGATVFDTGHEQFHRDSGGGIACASCHVEGTEDGRVWQFDPIGPRRTQPTDVGLQGTEPFHWDGDMENFSMLVNEVFVHRMGGGTPSADTSSSMSKWIFALQPRKPLVDAQDAGALRGKELFMSEGAQCSTCHSGKKFMSTNSVEVGTTEKGHALQVPSLLGVAYRAPFLHDGRARTLRERFDPSKGGGDKHGRTSHLNAAQIDDLIAYLSSI